MKFMVSAKAQKSKGNVTLPEARVIPTPTRVEVEAKETMAKPLSRGKKQEAKLRKD